MVETLCNICDRDISKHDPLALRVCLLKALREIERFRLSNKNGGNTKGNKVITRKRR